MRTAPHAFLSMRASGNGVAGADLWSPSCRGYSGKKLSENMECEIMQVIAQEAQESYRCGLISHPVCSIFRGIACHLAPTNVVLRLRCPFYSACMCCREEIVQVLPSNTVEELEMNVERTVQWFRMITCQAQWQVPR